MADCNYCTNYSRNSHERVDDCCLGKSDCRKDYFRCNEALKPDYLKAPEDKPKKKAAKKSKIIDSELTRRFDDLGRIVIPKDVRQKAFGTGNTEGKQMRIFYQEDGTIILKPFIIG